MDITDGSDDSGVFWGIMCWVFAVPCLVAGITEFFWGLERQGFTPYLIFILGLLFAVGGVLGFRYQAHLNKTGEGLPQW